MKKEKQNKKKTSSKKQTSPREDRKNKKGEDCPLCQVSDKTLEILKNKSKEK